MIGTSPRVERLRTIGAVSGLSLEQRLVISLAVAGLVGESPLGLPTSAMEQGDWPTAVRLATRQGVALLVQAGVDRLGLTVPAESAAKLRASCRASITHNAFGIEPTLRQAIESLAAEQIDSILLKGAALAYTVYPDPAQRTMADVDFLVRVEDLERASRALLAAGFVTAGSEQETEYHLAPFYLPCQRVGVELHRDLIASTSPFRLDVEHLWLRSRQASIAGTSARVLAIGDALLHACLHLAYSHRYGQNVLRGLLDILALTTTSRPEFDWERFLSSVRESRTRGVAYWALAMSSAWLGAPIPQEVLRALAPSPLASRLIAPSLDPRYLFEELGDQVSETVLQAGLRELSLYSGCSIREQVAVALGRLFPPPSAIGHLPEQVSRSRWRYLAYLMSPRRLAGGATALGRMAYRAVTGTNGSDVVANRTGRGR